MKKLIIIAILLVVLLAAIPQAASGSEPLRVYAPMVIRPYVCDAFIPPAGDADSVIAGGVDCH